jgi:hypothetical protein
MTQMEKGGEMGERERRGRKKGKSWEEKMEPGGTV